MEPTPTTAARASASSTRTTRSVAVISVSSFHPSMASCVCAPVRPADYLSVLSQPQCARVFLSLCMRASRCRRRYFRRSARSSPDLDMSSRYTWTFTSFVAAVSGSSRQKCSDGGGQLLGCVGLGRFPSPPPPSGHAFNRMRYQRVTRPRRVVGIGRVERILKVGRERVGLLCMDCRLCRIISYNIELATERSMAVSYSFHLHVRMWSNYTPYVDLFTLKLSARYVSAEAHTIFAD